MSDGPGDEPDDDDEDLSRYDTYPPNEVWPQAIGLPALPDGADGGGVTVAVLDTGVTRTADLGERVLARVDLTSDGDGYDRYGHGTHMIGIVAGDGELSGGRWPGVAPEARVVSVKIGSWSGATDVSMVLAGLEWIAAHRERYGIRVLSLSFGTDASQKWQLDPLNYAIQRLWRDGVLVVAAAGNRGGSGGKIDKPGDDPYVVTVGAADVHGTADTRDDTVAPFSSRGPTGENLAKPDLVAPGISIVSHRAPDSTIDGLRPDARVDDHHLKGTGTSQATAIVAGTAALMFQAAPGLTPDQAKAALVGTTAPDLAGHDGAGAGLVHAARAVAAARTGAFTDAPANRGLEPATGLGSIDSSRGSVKPFTDLDGDGIPEQVSGEIDALGNAFDARAWTTQPWSEASWCSSPWAGLTNLSPGWAVVPWPMDAWSRLSWDEPTWTSRSWRDAGLDPGGWTSRSWRGDLWH